MDSYIIYIQFRGIHIKSRIRCFALHHESGIQDQHHVDSTTHYLSCKYTLNSTLSVVNPIPDNSVCCAQYKFIVKFTSQGAIIIKL